MGAAPPLVAIAVPLFALVVDPSSEALPAKPKLA
jgi:hypothetical protein